MTDSVNHASKERRPIVTSERRQEEELRADIIELGKTPEIAPETGIEKLEKEQHILDQPVTDDQTGQVLVTSPQAQKPKIVLPLTVGEYQSGLKTSISNSMRWLSEWSRRLIKMLGYQVGFKQ